MCLVDGAILGIRYSKHSMSYVRNGGRKRLAFAIHGSGKSFTDIVSVNCCLGWNAKNT